MAALSPHRFSAAWQSRGALFSGFPSSIGSFRCSLFDSQPVIVHDATSLLQGGFSFLNVGAHVIICRASSLLPYGFSGANLY